MRTKRHAIFCDFAQLIKTEYLEAARVGKNRARPCHEAMQSAKLSHLLDPRPKIKVIGVPQKNLDAQFFENVLGNALDRGQCADGHEHRSFDFTVRRDQTTGAGCAEFSFDVKLDGHCEDCSGPR